MNDLTNQVKERVEQKILDKLELVGAFIKDEAKVRCPVATGNLRASINHKVIDEEFAVRIGTNVEYAPYVEFGTGQQAEDGKGNQKIKGQKPQPFLRPALLENKEQIKGFLK